MRSARSLSAVSVSRRPLGTSTETRLAKRAQDDRAIKSAGAVVGAGGTAAMATLAAVGVAFPPWSTIVAAGAAVTLAAVMAIVGGIRKRESKLIAGDKSAIKAFVKSSARWGAAKRKRVATRLLKQFQKHKAKGGKKAGFLGLGKKKKQDKDAWIARAAALKLKLAVLTALEIEAKRDSKSPLVAGDPNTIPRKTDGSAAANAMDASEALALGLSQYTWLGIGVAGVVIVAVVASSGGKEAA